MTDKPRVGRFLPARRTTAVSGTSTGPGSTSAADTVPTKESTERLAQPPGLEAGPASVSIRLGAKVSEAVYWGPGTWDKIPYSVEGHCEVTLPCGASKEQVALAQKLGGELAWQGVESLVRAANREHVAVIKDMYASYFAG